MRGRVAWMAGWVLGAALWATAARADAPEPTSPVDPHLEAGRKLLQEGKTKEACAELLASKEGGGSLESRLTLGRCYEALGKTASAYTQYVDITTLPDPGPSAAALVSEASQRAAALEGKLCRLKITGNAAQVAGATVQEDGVLVPASLLGRSVPVDPGEHEIVATAPLSAKQVKRVQVGQEGATVEVDIHFDLPTPPAAGAPPGILTPGRIAAVFVGGAGLFGLSAGLVLGVRAQTLRDSADKTPIGAPHCNDRNRCDAEGLALRDDAKSSALGSTVGLIAGGAFLVGAVTLWLLSPPRPAPPSTKAGGLGPTLQISLTGTGLGLGGTF